MDSQIFRMLGFSEKEEKIYLCSLRLGVATANTLAKISNLQRTTVYDILKSLIEKGYISYVIKSRVKYFEAASPEKVMNNIKEMEKRMKIMMPEILSLVGKGKEKPLTEIYEGKEGIKTIMDDLINMRRPILAISSTKDLLDNLPFYFPHYIQNRIKAKINIKVITERTKETEKLKRIGKKELRELRFTPITKNLKNAIFIYGDKIALLDLEELFGIVIKDRNLNLSLREIFNLLWKGSKL